MFFVSITLLERCLKALAEVIVDIVVTLETRLSYPEHPIKFIGRQYRVMRQRMIRFYEVLCSQHMERKATCEMRGFFISTISMPYLLRVKVSLFIFLKSPSFCNLGTRFLLRRGRGGV
jgi:hypothetical protein